MEGVLPGRLSGPALCAVIDAENINCVIFAIDPIHNKVGESGHDQLTGSSKCTLTSNIGECSEEPYRLANSLADTPRSVGISFRDIFCNAVEMPISPRRKPQLHKPNFFQVAANSISVAK